MKNAYLGKSKLPFLQSKMEPKVLYKQSNLKKDFRTGEIRITAVCFPDEGISVNADAKCNTPWEPVTVQLGKKVWNFNTIPFHKESPVRSCLCGFHAYNEYSPARNHDQNGLKGHFVLRVVGSGKMFEYKQGYRYGHQRLEEVVVAKCGSSSCTYYADRLLVGKQGHIMPYCYSCSRGTPIRMVESLMSFSEFEEAASKGLPPNAPRITIRSEALGVVPWERKLKSPEKTKEAMKQISKHSLSRLTSENTVMVGLTALLCSPMAIPLIGLISYYNSVR
jgi:hypothetical protein